MSDHKNFFSDQEALDYHKGDRPGKICIQPTKPMETQRDLSLAYSPGVAVPVQAIADDEQKSYDYTARGNLVAVISNGTAILGMGNLGASASKPVMEGKAVLFKRFADVDAIDLEVDTTDIDEFIGAVKFLGPSFGGINLEDIKSPECFIIEQKLREVMNIPVFHDDQHGTAIITAAGFINALDLTGRDIKKTKLVVCGAGAAAIACTTMLKAVGLPGKNIIMCDLDGVIYKGRTVAMDQWKSAFAAETKHRTLDDAIAGADVFLGLSAAGALTQDHVKKMADKPIIFAMANPNPEITPEAVKEVRSDAIMATGRSDYPNQVNNVLGFPYIFRGALDVRATTINEEMKVAAAHAIADLAREDVPDEVANAYAGERPKYGPDYIIPTPFDPRLIVKVPTCVAKAAMDSGVAQKPITDMEHYKTDLASRLNPTVATLAQMFEGLKKSPKNVVFAEAEEERVIQAAINYRNGGYGKALLVGQERVVRQRLKEAGVENMEGIEIHSARTSKHNDKFVEYLYQRMSRKGYLERDIRRMVNRDRNVFGSCMVSMGLADAMITGLTRQFGRTLNNVMMVVDPQKGHRVFGMSIMVTGGKTVFIADTAVSERPSAEYMADIAIQAADAARKLGHVPRVAFLSYSNFGNPTRESTRAVREAVKILDGRHVDFEYDGEMAADVALNPEMQKLYPFSRLQGPANVLIMPGLHAANISYKLLAELAGGRVIGPILWGLDQPIQICRMASTSNDILNMAGIAAMGSYNKQRKLEPLMGLDTEIPY